MTKKKKTKPINDYLGYEDLVEKAGYKSFTPKIGSFGKALLAASKATKSAKWLKEQLDVYFKKVRQKNKGQNDNKQN